MPRNTPLTLSFDTSAAHCAAALVCGDQVLGTKSEPMTKGQAERLMPMLEELLAEADKDWSDLETLAVGIGPGNFTGVRISVSTARGLALSLGIPAIGVSVFEALAYGTDGLVTISRDARRGMIFSQDFKDGLPIVEPALSEGTVVATDDKIDPVKMAFCAANKDSWSTPAPMYLLSPDAALPSDPPPTILP